MSKHIEFKRISPDDDSLYVTKDLCINGKKLTTPIKSLNLSKTNSKLLFNLLSAHLKTVIIVFKSNQFPNCETA